MAYTNMIGGGWATNGVPLLPQLMGIPFGGRYIFVDAVSGIDDNEGTADSPFQSIPAAYNAMTEGQNDVLILVQRPTTASTATGTFRLSATLAWAKSACHMVGITAPSMVAQRARISTATGALTNVNPLVRVTAVGCMFANFSTFQGVGESGLEEQLWSEQGQRNYYGNVAFGGMGGVAGAADADSYALRLYGGSENLFEHCYFGTDTRDRTAANTSVQIRKNAALATSARNIFRNCYFSMRATQTTPTFIDANEAGSTDRFTVFENCKFINTGTSSLAAVVAFHASQGGTIVMDNCTAVGCTDWTGSDTATVQIAGPVPNGDTSGMAVASDKT